MRIEAETQQEAIHLLKSAIKGLIDGQKQSGHNAMTCSCRCCSGLRLLIQGCDLFRLEEADRIVNSMCNKFKQRIE